VGAYTASIVLACMALLVLLAMTVYQTGWLGRRIGRGHQHAASDETIR
jgi:hypothetical protein